MFKYLTEDQQIETFARGIHNLAVATVAPEVSASRFAVFHVGRGAPAFSEEIEKLTHVGTDIERGFSLQRRFGTSDFLDNTFRDPCESVDCSETRKCRSCSRRNRSAPSRSARRYGRTSECQAVPQCRCKSDNARYSSGQPFAPIRPLEHLPA